MKVIVIPVDGPPRLEDVDATLKWLQEQVGGYIEVVPVSNGMEGALLVVNEEGKLEGLPPNRIATLLFNNPRDVIAGTAVVLGEADEEGDFTAVPEALMVALVPGARA